MGTKTWKVAGRARTLLGALMLAASVSGAAVGVSGCAVSESDVHRWETTERGPTKLYAVVTHDKYAFPLRVEAALSLIRMKARAGKHWGIPYLVDGFKDENGELKEGALVALAQGDRDKMIQAMAPELIQQMSQPEPPKNPDGSRPPDPSIPFKDAAFAIVSHEPPLVTDEKTKADFSAALTQWAVTDFEARIDASQQFGIEQMMRFLGAPSVKGLPALINEQSTKIDRIASLVHDLGDPDTKLKASSALVTLAKTLDSKAWVDKQLPLVEEADKRAGQKVTKEQLAKQVQTFQDQELTKVFTAMKKVGGRPSVEYLLGYSADKSKSEDERKASLAALEGSVDKSQTKDIEILFEIAKDDATPDAARDLAFQRLGELPKEVVVPKMYQLFEGKKWKVRWVAASLVLHAITTKSLGDFMNHLPKSAAQKFAQTEPITYGSLVQKMDAPSGEPKPRDAILPYLASHEMGPKLTALGFFYGGKKADVGVVQPYADDTMPVSKCGEGKDNKDDDCGWQCEVPKPGGQDKETKDIHTVGDFVKYCVVPSMTAP